MTRAIPKKKRVPHPANELRNLKRRVNRARDFPNNTCPGSRHVHMMAEYLAAGKRCAMLEEEPQHCASSMLAVVEALWKARTELHELKQLLTKQRGAS